MPLDSKKVNFDTAEQILKERRGTKYEKMAKAHYISKLYLTNRRLL